MENRKPEFAFKEHSVISLVTEMRAYFQDLKSYYSISKGEIISRLDETSDDTRAAELKAKLIDINEKIAFFSMLGDSLSIADTVLHTDTMLIELGFKKKS
ncbi:hypothetical protein [Gloeocapsa sp. PCC 73106]|uniref:hypothetical protein n=1 Tax=Gloeocapsa sp. PCC 73106 TaxID=102232 RepID=UPI0002ABEB5E|nr:hypothetical protein [Gloeocapsa sp. PCC 73106]ELR99000.1 hypothetical protein GLO73106DRAFT_00028430 [Gloeocapsa sp. PCC 73106]